MTEKYATGLPVGCMLGYVMNGKLGSARSKIEAALESHEKLVGLAAGAADAEPVGGIRRFTSRHHRADGGEIELRHALLAF